MKICDYKVIEIDFEETSLRDLVKSHCSYITSDSNYIYTIKLEKHLHKLVDILGLMGYNIDDVVYFRLKD
jgi:hypothetical protein